MGIIWRRKKRIVSWRKEACKILKEMNFDGVIYVPEHSSWILDYDYDDNVKKWERNALKKATVILFWVPRKLPDIPAFTTNVEFGYWLHSGKVVYGRPENADKIKYLDWLYKEDYGKSPCNDLKGSLKQALKLIDELL